MKVLYWQLVLVQVDDQRIPAGQQQPAAAVCFDGLGRVKRLNQHAVLLVAGNLDLFGILTDQLAQQQCEE